MNTIFLSFSIRNSSVTEFFVEFANLLSKSYKVIIIADVIGDHPFLIVPEVKIYKWMSRKQKDPKNLLFLARMVRRHKPKMMISNFTSVNYFLFVGYLLRVPIRIAWCHSISGAFGLDKPIFNRKKYVYRLATAVFANSHATKKDLIENFSVKSDKIEVIYNAVREYNSTGDNQVDPNQILFVGRMDPSKGVEILLKAIPEVVRKFPQVKFKFVGGNIAGKEIADFKKEAQLLEINKNVSFLGYQKKETVLKELARSYVTVVPSLLEGFGYVVIESFSVKTPVIGSNTTGIVEIIRDGVDGFLFEPGNSIELSECILQILDSRDTRSTFSENCYWRFRQCFEIKGAIEELCKKVDQKMAL